MFWFIHSFFVLDRESCVDFLHVCSPGAEDAHEMYMVAFTDKGIGDERRTAHHRGESLLFWKRKEDNIKAEAFNSGSM